MMCFKDIILCLYHNGDLTPEKIINKTNLSKSEVNHQIRRGLDLRLILEKHGGIYKINDKLRKELDTKEAMDYLLKD